MTDKDAALKQSHNDLYLAVRRLEAIIHRERAAHPRTKVWKDLERITQTIDEIQKDWFHTHGR
jgi:type VI protein secretion system component VasF